MPRRTTDIVLAVVTILGLVLVGFWSSGAFTPAKASLEDAVRLARLKRFGDAEREVSRVLASHPDDASALLLAAQLRLEQGEPRPTEALEFLGELRPNPASLAALFCLERGKSHYYLGDYAKAEASWLEAIKLDPAVPEAGWALLDLYYVQGRTDECSSIAFQLRKTEPDPRDRVLLLLELVRGEARQLAAPLVVTRLERALKANPNDLQSIVGIGRALVRDSRLDEGLERLREGVRLAPEKQETWDALLTGLDDAGKAEEFAATLAKLPPSLSDSPAFLRHRGREAQNRQDWTKAVKFYQAAMAYRGDQATVAYRLSRVLRATGDLKAAEAIEPKVRAFEAAANEVQPLYDEADSIKSHGVEPQPKLYNRLGDLCEKLGRLDQAEAWYLLVLESTPDDTQARAGLERIKKRKQ